MKIIIHYLFQTSLAPANSIPHPAPRLPVCPLPPPHRPPLCRPFKKLPPRHRRHVFSAREAVCLTVAGLSCHVDVDVPRFPLRSGLRKRAGGKAGVLVLVLALVALVSSRGTRLVAPVSWHPQCQHHQHHNPFFPPDKRTHVSTLSYVPDCPHLQGSKESNSVAKAPCFTVQKPRRIHIGIGFGIGFGIGTASASPLRFGHASLQQAHPKPK